MEPDEEKSKEEKSSKLGRKLAVVCKGNDDIPEKSGYSCHNASMEKSASPYTSSDPSSSTPYPSFSSMSPYEKQHLVDEHVHCIVDPWIGSLPFTVFKWYKSIGDVSKIFTKEPMNIDIATCLNGQSYPTERLYSCPTTYPPPPLSNEPLPKELHSFICLKRNLEKFAHKCGSPIL